jgi:rare lipoprotein A
MKHFAMFLIVICMMISERENKTVDYVDLGIMRVSWYGEKFNGRKTASGELFNQNLLTAAHKTMDFGTLLKVTNPENGKSVIVKINDRGPYIFGRSLDVSKRAAIELGISERGTAKLKVEEMVSKDNSK